jgi:hypothetical protein
MLVATLAAAAALQADRSEHAQRGWLALGAVLSVLCVWLHYTGAGVVAALTVWVALNRRFRALDRRLFVLVCAVGLGALYPEWHAQYIANPNGGLLGIAGLTGRNALVVVGTPFDGRASGPVDVFTWLGAFVVVASLGFLAWRGRMRVREPTLLLAAALTTPAIIFVFSAAGKDVLITRYTAVAAPFLLIVISTAVMTAPRALGWTLFAAALVAAAVGSARSHRPSGFYVDARGVINYIAAARAPGDVVVTPGQADPDTQLTYYGEHRLSPPPLYVRVTNRAAVARIFSEHRRAWFISPASHDLAGAARALLAPLGYRPLKVRTFPANLPLGVVLAGPRTPLTRPRRSTKAG